MSDTLYDLFIEETSNKETGEVDNNYYPIWKAEKLFQMACVGDIDGMEKYYVEGGGVIMVRRIEERLYCVTNYMGTKWFIEAKNEEELAVFVAEQESKGWSVSSVKEICPDGSTPRVAIKSSKAYKQKFKELLG